VTDNRIDLVDHKTEAVVPVPAETLDIVERADRIVEEAQRHSLRHIPLDSRWSQFEQDRVNGWLVSLHLFTPEHDYGQQVRVDDLRDPKAAKEFVWDVVSRFGSTLNDKAGVMIRQLRADLRNMQQPAGE